MKYRNFLASAAVAAVLASSGVASAQVLGGNVTGGLGGSVTGNLGGGLGNVGATGSGAVNGTLGAGTDAVGRVRDTASRVKDKAKE